jgi:hypothetical protein
MVVMKLSTRCLCRALATAALLVSFVRAQDPPATDVAERKERLEFMKRQAAEYTVTLNADTPVKLALHDEPLLRFSNPVGGVPDGIVVMWKDGPRPAIFAQVFQIKSGTWIHECQSMAPVGLTMQSGDVVRWQPKSGSDEFHPLADAPAGAETNGRRLVQMKALAGRFAASDDFKISSTDKETTRHELRLLPTPVYRYEDKAAGIRDAAVFAFVHGTDPEVFLTLEYRDEGGKGGWHYALAPMTCWAVEARLDGKEVWSVPERLGKNKPSDSYHVWKYIPGTTNAAR